MPGNIEDDDEEDAEKDAAESLLRDFQYQIKCQFMERSRGLKAGLYPPLSLGWFGIIWDNIY